MKESETQALIDLSHEVSELQLISSNKEQILQVYRQASYIIQKIGDLANDFHPIADTSGALDKFSTIRRILNERK